MATSGDYSLSSNWSLRFPRSSTQNRNRHLLTLPSGSTCLLSIVVGVLMPSNTAKGLGGWHVWCQWGHPPWCRWWKEKKAYISETVNCHSRVFHKCGCWLRSSTWRYSSLHGSYTAGVSLYRKIQVVTSECGADWGHPPADTWVSRAYLQQELSYTVTVQTATDSNQLDHGYSSQEMLGAARFNVKKVESQSQ